MSPWEIYDWSPDGSQIAYDRLTYSPTGTERIFTRPRLDGAEQQISPDLDQGYAFYPVYSPDGMQIAYLINPGGPESVQHTLVVQDLASGETPRAGQLRIGLVPGMVLGRQGAGLQRRPA